MILAITFSIGKAVKKAGQAQKKKHLPKFSIESGKHKKEMVFISDNLVIQYGNGYVPRADWEIKNQMALVLARVVNKAFHKRGFVDDFSEEERSKINELQKFLRDISLHKNKDGALDNKNRYFCFTFKTVYKRKNGQEISVFHNKFIHHKEIDYPKIENYIASCLYKLIRKKNIEVYFAMNSFRVNEKEINGKTIYFPERTKECTVSSCCVYTDIDLPESMANLSNEQLLTLLKEEFSDVYYNLPFTYLNRSGNGLHAYWVFNHSVNLITQQQIQYYTDMLKGIQKIFINLRSDPRCVDITRILRPIYSYNRKQKFKPNGKEVVPLISSGITYEVEEFECRLQFILDGGMDSLYREVVEEFSQYDEIEQPEADEESEAVEETAATIDEPKERTQSDRERSIKIKEQKLSEYGYRGIQKYYEGLYNQSFWGNRDLLKYVQNRTKHTGLRHSVLFIACYNWVSFCAVRDEDTLLSKAQEFNSYFNPPLSDSELRTYIVYLYNYLRENAPVNKCIKNTIIQNALHTTDEEQTIFEGIYCYTREEYIQRDKEKRAKRDRDRHTKKLNGKPRKSERKAMNIELLRANPSMTYEEFGELTGLSRSRYKDYLRELGRGREYKKQQNKEKYLAPFYDNPNITFEEYKAIMNCSKTCYWKYSTMFKRENPL